MRNILVNNSKCTTLDKQPVEIVERKGVGHPDSMCDAIMDQVSVELSKADIKAFGGTEPWPASNLWVTASS